MSKECKHAEWNPCGNDFYSCRKCGILRTSQQVNLYAEKDRQIADLEAKLAKSEEKVKAMETLIETVGEDSKLNFRRYIDTLAKNEQLEKQLAEKEKEIEDTKHFKITIGTMENNQVDISSTTYADQDKISFAINELVKVKNFVNYRHFDFVPDGLIEIFEVEKKINNQIEELKKELNK